MTRMDQLPEGEAVTVTPMRTFPIIRDLVTDVCFNYEMAKTVPAFRPPPRPADGYRMDQIDVERGQEFRKCIECFMCQDVCHVIRDHEENKPTYAGPASSSATPSSRCTRSTPTTGASCCSERGGLGLCNITKCCTEVCPEHIKITDNAIIPMKERVVDASLRPGRLAGPQDPAAQEVHGRRGHRLGRLGPARLPLRRVGRVLQPGSGRCRPRRPRGRDLADRGPRPGPGDPGRRRCAR